MTLTDTFYLMPCSYSPRKLFIVLARAIVPGPRKTTRKDRSTTVCSPTLSNNDGSNKLKSLVPELTVA